MALQLRRGTNQERLGITLVEGEMVYVTDHAYTSIAVTGLNATTNTLTTTLQHGLSVGDQIKFMDATANGLTAQTVYYVKTVPDVTSFTLSTTSGGSTLDITGTYSAELEFATGPTNGTGAPLGYSVSPLWAGDGVTIGGVAAGSTLLEDLLDVEVGVYGNVSQYGEALANNNVLQYNDTTGQWENRANLTVGGNATVSGNLYVNGANVYFNYDDAPAADVVLHFNNDDARITYDNAETRFEFNKDILANGVQGGNVKMGMSADNVINIGSDHLYLQTDNTSYKVILNTGLVASGDIETTGQNLSINSDSTAADSYIYLKGTSASIKYNNTSGYIETPNIAVGNTYITSGNISTGAGNLTLNAAGGTIFLSDPIEVTGAIAATGTVSTTAQSMTINSDSTAADSYLYFKGTSEWLQWSESGNGFYFSNDLAVNGDLRLYGNQIANSAGTLVITMTGTDVAITGNLTVTGNNIKSSTATVMTLSGANVSMPGNLTITGDLTVNGTTTTLDTTNLLVEDNVIVINKNETGAGVTAGTAGIEVERGSLTNATWLWDETNDWWASSGDIWASGAVIAGTHLATNGDNLYFNNEEGGSGATTTITVKRGTNADVAVRWNETTDRWETTVDGSTWLALPNQALDTTSTPTFASATIGKIDINTTVGQIDTNNGSDLTLDSDGGNTYVRDTFYVRDNSNITKFFVDPDNSRVGVNTATPAYTLDVVGIINTNNSVYCADVVIDATATYNTVTTTTTSTTTTAISASTRSTQKVVITITDDVTGNMHVLEALAFQHGSNAYLTTYGEMYTSAALATFTADVSGGNIRILATPASTNSTTFKVARVSVD